jgi:hypothetical protein
MTSNPKSPYNCGNCKNREKNANDDKFCKVNGEELSGLEEDWIETVGCASHYDLKNEIDSLTFSKDWYERRANLLQKCQIAMRDPERTIVCDVLANGSLLDVGDRYKIKPDVNFVLTHYNSTALIGNARERFTQLSARPFDWSSFYNGWLEGRTAMLGEIKELDER